MINRYSIYAPADELAKRYDLDPPAGYQIRYNASPTDLLPIITSTLPRGFSNFYWGTSPKRSKNKPVSHRLINTTAQSIVEKPGYRMTLESRRCLIPASSYFSWKNISKKGMIPYCIQSDQNIFSFAGLWEEYEDEDNQSAHTFSIITVASNSLLLEMGPTMPAILLQEAEKIWMNPSSTISQLIEVLLPYPVSKMKFHPVSHLVDSLGANSERLIQPSEPMDQYGNYRLFE